MMDIQRLNFKVADCFFRINFYGNVDGRQYLRGFRPFHIENTEKHLLFDLHVKDNYVSHLPEGTEICHVDVAGAMHYMYKLDDGSYKMVIYDENNQLVCAFNTITDFTQANISLYGKTINDKTFGLNNAIMIIFAYVGAKYRILMMHSSVIMNDGKGFLFLGKSGTGKSTHSDLWCKYIAGSKILNDDNPVVRICNNTIYVYGSPWSGKRDYYIQKRVPVKAFVNLEQATSNEITQLSKLESFGEILTSCATMMWDKSVYDEICQTASMVASQIPMFHLKNLPNKDAATLSAAHCRA